MPDSGVAQNEGPAEMTAIRMSQPFSCLIYFVERKSGTLLRRRMIYSDPFLDDFISLEEQVRMSG